MHANTEPDDFVDLAFGITSCTTAQDGTRRILAKALHDGQVVGLAIELGPGWAAGKAGGTNLNRGKLVYKSIGVESDRLVAALSQAYGVPVARNVMVESVSFTAISLKGDPSRPEAGPVDIKLFFEDGKEDDYAEFFTNLDLAKGTVYVNEKDAGYRKPLLRAIGSE